MILAVPAGLLLLPALALAAGVDLYLTLLFLGVAPALGLWQPLPGALGDLSSTGVLVLTGAFYLAEVAAERAFTPSLIWNGLHAIIRPLAGFLLALLLLDGSTPFLLVGGAIVSAVLASSAHAVATGGVLLLRLDRNPPVRPFLASLLEDVSVLGLLSLTLDRPAWSAVVAGVAALAGLRLAGSQLRAFLFSVRLVLGRIRGLLGGGRWTRRDELPNWLGEAVDRGSVVPPRIQATPGAALRLPGRPRLVRGWLVIRGERPLFIHGRSPSQVVELDGLSPTTVRDEGFLRTARLSGAAAESDGPPPTSPTLLVLTRDGPSLQSLRAELAPRDGAPEPT